MWAIRRCSTQAITTTTTNATKQQLPSNITRLGQQRITSQTPIPAAPFTSSSSHFSTSSSSPLTPLTCSTTTPLHRSFSTSSSTSPPPIPGVPRKRLSKKQRQRAAGPRPAGLKPFKLEGVSLDAAIKRADENRAAAAKWKATKPLTETVSDITTSGGRSQSSTSVDIVMQWNFPNYFDPRYEPPPISSFKNNPGFQFEIFDPKRIGVSTQLNEKSLKVLLDERALQLWHRRYQYWISPRATKTNALKIRQRQEYVARGWPTRYKTTEENFQKFVMENEEYQKWQDAAELEGMTKPKQFDPALEPSSMFPNGPTKHDRYHPSFEPIAKSLWSEYGITAKDSEEYKVWFDKWLQDNPAISKQREVYQRLVRKYVEPVWRARADAESQLMIKNAETRAELGVAPKLFQLKAERQATVAQLPAKFEPSILTDDQLATIDQSLEAENDADDEDDVDQAAPLDTRESIPLDDGLVKFINLHPKFRYYYRQLTKDDREVFNKYYDGLPDHEQQELLANIHKSEREIKAYQLGLPTSFAPKQTIMDQVKAVQYHLETPWRKEMAQKATEKLAELAKLPPPTKAVVEPLNAKTIEIEDLAAEYEWASNLLALKRTEGILSQKYTSAEISSMKKDAIKKLGLGLKDEANDPALDKLKADDDKPITEAEANATLDTESVFDRTFRDSKIQVTKDDGKNTCRGRITIPADISEELVEVIYKMDDFDGAQFSKLQPHQQTAFFNWFRSELPNFPSQDLVVQARLAEQAEEYKKSTARAARERKELDDMGAEVFQLSENLHQAFEQKIQTKLQELADSTPPTKTTSNAVAPIDLDAEEKSIPEPIRDTLLIQLEANKSLLTQFRGLDEAKKSELYQFVQTELNQFEAKKESVLLPAQRRYDLLEAKRIVSHQQFEHDIWSQLWAHIRDRTNEIKQIRTDYLVQKRIVKYANINFERWWNQYVEPDVGPLRQKYGDREDFYDIPEVQRLVERRLAKSRAFQHLEKQMANLEEIEKRLPIVREKPVKQEVIEASSKLVPNPYVKPPEIVTDQFGMKHSEPITEESQILDTTRTDIDVPFEYRRSGTVALATALHHFELRRRPKSEIDREFAQIKSSWGLLTAEEAKRANAKTEYILQALKAAQLRRDQEDGKAPKPAPVEQKRLTTSELVDIPSNVLAAEMKNTADIARIPRKPLLTEKDFKTIVVQGDEIDRDLLNTVILEHIDEYELVPLDKYGRRLTKEQVDLAPRHILDLALARIGYTPNPFHDYHLWSNRTVGSASLDLNNREAMINLYMEKFSWAALKRKRAELEYRKDTNGNWIPYHLRKEEQYLFDLMEETRDQEKELFEIMTEEEIAIWKEYHSDEGMVKWIASGGLLKTQAEYMEEVRRGAALGQTNALEDQISDYPALVGTDLTLDANDEIILGPEKDRVVEHFMTLKEIQWNPELYVNFFRHDCSGEFTEEGKKFIEDQLLMLPTEKERIAFLKQMLYWKQIVGGEDTVDDDFDIGKWMKQRLEDAKTLKEQRVKASIEAREAARALKKKRFETKNPEEEEAARVKAEEEKKALEVAAQEPKVDENGIVLRPVLGPAGEPVPSFIVEVKKGDKIQRMKRDARGQLHPLTINDLRLYGPPRKSFAELFAIAATKRLKGAEVVEEEDELKDGGDSDEQKKLPRLWEELDAKGEEEVAAYLGSGDKAKNNPMDLLKMDLTQRPPGEEGEELDPVDYSSSKKQTDFEHPLLSTWAKPSTLRHVKELPHMDPARYNEYQALLNLKQRLYKMLTLHFPSSGITLKLNQPQLFYPDRKFRDHYGSASPNLRKAVSYGHSAHQLFQVIFLMRKYRNPGILAEHISREIGNARSHTGVLRAVENVVEWMGSIPGSDLGLMIKVSGRINGAARSAHYVIKSGNVPVQTIHANMDYALAHGHARIGVFGIKVWLFQRRLDRKDVQSYALLRKPKQKTRNKFL